jgi:hypothetical protein
VSRAAVLALAAAVCAVPGLAACGGEDVVVQEAPTAAERGVAPAAGGTVERDPLRSGADADATLMVTVDDVGETRVRYRAARTVKAGLVEIRLHNRARALHKAQLWRIDGDHSVKEALRIRHPLPDWLRTAGGGSLTEPGKTSRTLQTLSPGRYYIAGTLGQPGSVASFEAIGPQPDRELPRAPARVEARDFSFRVSGLRAGRNSIDFDNTGAQPHHAFFAPMRAGVELAAVKQFFRAPTSVGEPPVTDRTRETVIVEGGERQIAQIDLTPGRYALICFVRDRGGGPRHIELGMINEVTVR